MGMKFDDVYEGDTLDLPYRAILTSCCGCGLSHMYVIVMVDGEPKLKVYSDREGTNEIRAAMSSRQIESVIKEFQTLRRKCGKINKAKSNS